MWRSPFSNLIAPFLLILVSLLINTHAATKSKWLTLTGNPPAIIARGGFSGLFPDSSEYAYIFTYQTSSEDTISWCDVQLTKDGVGLCLPSMLLDNCTDINTFFPNGMNNYSVNGVPTSGWFSTDFKSTDLATVSLMRQIDSRSNKFDSSFPILTAEDVVAKANPPALWLNIQHDMFYKQHNLSMRSYLISVSKRVIVGYVSSPEVGFLKSIVTRFKGSKTKLVFRFLDADMMEPSLNQTYGSLLKNLALIKTFASAIIVPKSYIWPVSSDNYLQPHTSVVMDAHKEGLEVYASTFANDDYTSYNYSYDPLSEYLNFIDNGVFSVDGVLTDFPITASEAIDCFSHMNKTSSGHGKPLIISHHGASGIYPDCTDLAYKQAVDDGADVIDCPVQVTQDGTLVCMSSINLMDDTSAASSSLRSNTSTIPQLDGPGLYTFNFTWDVIQKNLKPKISNPQLQYQLYRNPRYANAGNFMKLSEFLAYAKRQPLSGILITIENAAFLAENLGYSIVDAVIDTLKDSGYHNQTVQEVMIESTNSSVLTSFKQKTNYNLVYMVDEESIGSADASALADMKKFADSVAVNKKSVYPVSLQFTMGETDLITNLQNHGFSVFVYLLSNEFVSQAWDFFSDPTVEINSLVQAFEVNGIITDFPGTSARYRSNTCSKLGNKAPRCMVPVRGGNLLTVMSPNALPPALAPLAVLDASDVMEPPLPNGSTKPSTNTVAPTAHPSAGDRHCVAVSVSVSFVMALISGFLVMVV